MIDLKLLDVGYLDIVLTNESTQYLKVRNNTGLAPRHSVVLELLQYARRVLYFGVVVTKVLSTSAGKQANSLLLQRNAALREEISRRMKEQRKGEGAGLVDLVKLEEMPCFETVHGLIVAHRGVMTARYSQARLLTAPETCILKFGKLLLEAGAQAVAVCDVVLDFAGFRG